MVRCCPQTLLIPVTAELPREHPLFQPPHWCFRAHLLCWGLQWGPARPRKPEQHGYPPGRCTGQPGPHPSRYLQLQEPSPHPYPITELMRASVNSPAAPQPAPGRTTPAQGTREEKPVPLTLLHHRRPACTEGESGAAAGGEWPAPPQGHREEEEEERGRGCITAVLQGLAALTVGPRSVDAASRGSSPACRALLHPSSVNKASAAPGPPLPLTHGLTVPNPRTSLV